MYYEIKKDSPLGNQLASFWEKVKAARKACYVWARKQSDKPNSRIMLDSYALAGRLTGIEFKKRPDGWCNAMPSGYPGFYRPKKLSKNKKLLAEMESFTVVTKDELLELFGLKSRLYGDKYFQCVGFKVIENSYLISVPVYVDDWTPPSDMKEILTSRYLELTNKKQLQS